MTYKSTLFTLLILALTLQAVHAQDQTHDFGEVSEKEGSVTHCFPVKDAEDVSVECSCTTYEFQGDSLVCLTLDLTDRSGDVQKYAIVTTSSGEEVRLDLVVNVVSKAEKKALAKSRKKTTEATPEDKPEKIRKPKGRIKQPRLNRGLPGRGNCPIAWWKIWKSDFVITFNHRSQNQKKRGRYRPHYNFRR